MPERTSRIVFFGTPDAAATALRALLAAPDAPWRVVGVVTRPPAAVGRSQRTVRSPVHEVATQHGVPVATPSKLDADFAAWLRAHTPDVAVLSVYGKILPPDVLAVPRLGFVNIHPSLLPRHRGPSPVVSSILAGDTQTGVSIMQLDELVDHGPLLAQAGSRVPPDATGGSLTNQLAADGAALLVATLPRFLAGELTTTTQDHTRATTTHKHTRESGQLDWSQPAQHLERTVRAFDPWPSTYTCWNGKRLKILAVSVVDASAPGQPGTISLTGGRLLVATGAGTLQLKRVQLEGSTAQDVAEFTRGHADLGGARLGPC